MSTLFFFIKLVHTEKKSDSQGIQAKEWVLHIKDEKDMNITFFKKQNFDF